MWCLELWQPSWDHEATKTMKLRTEEQARSIPGPWGHYFLATNWPLGSPALDSHYVRIKCCYHTSHSQPGILLLAVNTSWFTLKWLGLQTTKTLVGFPPLWNIKVSGLQSEVCGQCPSLEQARNAASGWCDFHQSMNISWTFVAKNTPLFWLLRWVKSPAGTLVSSQ